MDEREIAKVVQEVIRSMSGAGDTTQTVATVEVPQKKLRGVFQTMDEALAAVEKAYNEFRNYSHEQREAMITQIRRLCRENAETMAHMGVEETGMGNVYHKTLKHRLVADKTPGTEDLTTTAWSGDHGLTLIEMAPHGIIGAITPSTNPSETVICNSIGMIAAGNGVVFNPHPHAKKVSNYAVDLVNRAILEAGGPENLVCSVENPTMESSNTMMKSPLVKMLVATGGPGVVKALLSSGKKAIGAGAGNPPVVVDDDVDIKKAAIDILDGCTFDNNLPCIAEKEVFALSKVADDLVYYMLQNGGFLLEGDKVEELYKIVTNDGKGLNRKCVGRHAKELLKMIGVTPKEDTRCIICQTDASHPFVQTELMMPILPVVSVPDFDTAVALAVEAEHGNRHSAHIHSKNIDHITQYARAMGTTILVKNAPSYCGIGFNAEGYTTFTIAGPTGEGLTSAKTFTRARRCVMVDAMNIV